MLYEKDTIAAISTPPGIGGIGIIRISGKDSIEIANKIFKSSVSVRDMEDHTIRYGKIIDPKNHEVLDEVMLTKMLAPKTYTMEDIIEINCHGGIVSLRKILALVFSLGARPAEPGEFTKRAFLNGRIDLSQAEAVIDLINSRTSQSHKAALSQLEGRLSNKLNNIIDKLLNILAAIEVTVDYPEHDDEYSTGLSALEDINIILNELQDAEKSYETGRIIKNGVKTVISGKPNAGKSTLLNELSGYNRAIVTDIPGTTRDLIEEEINIDGIPFIFTDTAGIRETSDIVEKFGVDRAREAVEKGDLIILVIDLTDPDPTDNNIINLIKNKKCLIVLNKKDLVDYKRIELVAGKISEVFHGDKSDIKIVAASLINGDGTDEIRKAISGLLHTGEISQNNEILITAERHRNLILKAIQSLNDAVSAFESGMPLDMISIDIRNCANYIGEITGQSVTEDLVDRIFSTFCLGK